jgi:hypothetical protein
VRGATYLLEKLQDCRRHQDRLLTLTSEVERELATAKREARAWKTALSVAGASAQLPDLRKKWHAAQDGLDDLRGLERSLNYARHNMKTTDSDIRLASGLVDLQFKIGEVRPPADEPAPAPPAPQTSPTIVPPEVPSVTAETAFASDPRPANPVEVSAQVDDISAFLSEVR